MPGKSNCTGAVEGKGQIFINRGVLERVKFRNADCGFRISDFRYVALLIFKSAIRNLKSAIDFAPILH
jgi:hypothetical protein